MDIIYLEKHLDREGKKADAIKKKLKKESKITKKEI